MTDKRTPLSAEALVTLRDVLRYLPDDKTPERALLHKAVRRLRDWHADRIDPQSMLLDADAAAAYLLDTYGCEIHSMTVRRKAKAGSIPSVGTRFTRELLDHSYHGGAFERPPTSGRKRKK